ncbi:MAG: FAD:protein FMN transferase [Balneolaceae bacterium]|nr:FAD:protein FMN transferase [Balneolaceae bacterium]
MSQTSSLYKNGFYAMATRFYMLLPGMDDAAGDELFQKIKGEVNRVESRLSRFIKESEVAKINKNAFQSEVKTDEEIFEILKACKYGWELTDGAFDVTLRPLMEYWKDSEEQEEKLFEQIRNSVGMQHIALDEEKETVQFDNEIIELDFGGFGKGYVLENVKKMLVNLSAKNAFISFGESSVLAMGEHPAGGEWKIGINNYKNPGNSIHEFELTNGSVSTSSNFYLNDDGELQNHRHVINPETGKVHEPFLAVSVSAESPILAEMLSTAGLMLPDEKIHNLVKKYEDIEIIKIDYEPDEPAITIF